MDELRAWPTDYMLERWYVFDSEVGPGKLPEWLGPRDGCIGACLSHLQIHRYSVHAVLDPHILDPHTYRQP